MSRMRSFWPALSAAGFLVLAHTGAAQAQIINPFGVNNGNALTSSDYKVAGAAVKKLLDETPAVGRYEDWSNPATGNSGKLTILGLSTKDNMPCRKVSSHTVYSKKGAPDYDYVLTACQIPSGQWKVAS